MKYKGIIFDLDGVICFTDKYHYQAWKKMADGIGVYFDEVINNRLRGVSRMASLDIILERADREYFMEEKEALAAQKNESYRELLLTMTPEDLPKEVKDTLKQLRAEGVKLAIGSSSKNTKLILERIGLGDFFDAVSDGTNITHSKPNPEVFLKAAEFLGLEPADCLVVEDADAGIDAAAAGGFDSAGIGEAAKHEKTTYPLEKFSDLIHYNLNDRGGLVMVRKGFKMHLYPGMADEYEKRHNTLWPEMKEMIHEYGGRNYSIYLDTETNVLYGYLEVEDEEKWAKSADTAVNRKWWDYMADIMETNPDNSPVCIELSPMFHLD